MYTSVEIGIVGVGKMGSYRNPFALGAGSRPPELVG